MGPKPEECLRFSNSSTLTGMGNKLSVMLVIVHADKSLTFQHRSVKEKSLKQMLEFNM